MSTTDLKKRIALLESLLRETQAALANSYESDSLNGLYFRIKAALEVKP